MISAASSSHPRERQPDPAWTPAPAAPRVGRCTERPPVCVADVMCRRVVSCLPFDRLLEAGRTMLLRRLGCLPVVASDGSRRLVGILTDRDVSLAALRGPQSFGELHVRSAMTPGGVCCDPSDTLSAALDQMKSSGLHRLLVVDRSGCLVGLISRGDIARVVALGSRGARLPTHREVCSTLAARVPEDREGRG